MPFDYPDLAIALWTAIGLLGVVLAWQRMLLPTLVEGFRQDLFDLRRDLFLLMADNEFPAHNPAYAWLRDTINGLLRYAERLTLLRSTITRPYYKAEGDAAVARFTRGLRAIRQEELRHELETMARRLSGIISLHLVRISPVLWPFFLYFLARAALQQSGAVIVRTQKQLSRRLPIQTIQAEALQSTVAA